jgi:hypothetical protein
MKITQKRLKEIIKEELENLNLSEMDDTSSDTAAAMEGSDHMALLQMLNQPGWEEKFRNALSTLPREVQMRFAKFIMNPMGGMNQEG